MSYAIEEMANNLRATREARGLSQRELSTMSGVPQGHISKIENGTVNLRLSSLVELARALDLELTLVPRKSLPAVQAIVRSVSGGNGSEDAKRHAGRELIQLRNIVNSLPKQTIPQREFEQYTRVLRELEHFRLSQSDLEAIRNAASMIKKFKESTEIWEFIRQSLKEMQRLRNSIAHGRNEGEREAIRPAYSLEDNDHG